MKITNFKPVILEKAEQMKGKTPYTTPYKLQDGRIFVLLKGPQFGTAIHMSLYREYYNNLCRKLKVLDELRGIRHLMIPEELSLTESGRLKGYYLESTHLKPLDELLEETYDINAVSSYYEDIATAIESLHENDIVVPDLLTQSNVWFDKESQEVKLMNYEGMQIGTLPSVTISSGLQQRQNSVLRTPKYTWQQPQKYMQSDRLYTKELDYLSIVDGYFHDLTGINLAEVPVLQQYSNGEGTEMHPCDRYYAETFFKSLGIQDQESIDAFIKPFSQHQANENPKKLIKSFSQKYETNGKVFIAKEKIGTIE